MVEQPEPTSEQIAAAVGCFIQALDILGYEEVCGWDIARALGVSEYDVRAVVQDFELPEGVHVNV